MKKYPAWYLAYVGTGFMMDTGYIRPDIAFKKGWDAALNWKRRKERQEQKKFVDQIVSGTWIKGDRNEPKRLTKMRKKQRH